MTSNPVRSMIVKQAAQLARISYDLEDEAGVSNAIERIAHIELLCDRLRSIAAHLGTCANML